MELVMQKNINNVLVDGLSEGVEAYFTRLQIGELLEYDNPQHAIMKIHNRHKERLDQFSRWAQFETPSGRQEGYVYNIRGVFEICRWSRQPKANEVMDKLYDFGEDIFRVGYATMLSDEQLYELLGARIKKDRSLAHSVVVPALQDARADQAHIVSDLLGIPSEKLPKRIINKSNSNKSAKLIIEARGNGDYTEKDIQPPIEVPQLKIDEAILMASRNKATKGFFVTYGTELHFDINGYYAIIDYLKKNCYINFLEADAWKQKVYRHEKFGE